MATLLIPTLGTCVARTTGGERRRRDGHDFAPRTAQASEENQGHDHEGQQRPGWTTAKRQPRRWPGKRVANMHDIMHGAAPMPAASLHAGLRRTVQFAQVLDQPEIVAPLSQQLSWSHFVSLLPLKTDQAHQFYASQAATHTWSVRELRQQIERKAFERTELAALQVTPVQAAPVEASAASPAQVFKDPHFLEFLGLRQGHDEADLELPSTQK